MMSGLPLPADANEREFGALVAAARTKLWPPEEVALLAKHLAASGQQLTWSAEQPADVASTGGPGSLSTLLAPLALRAKGAQVVKLGVPGRPAGAIDSLGSLPSYRVRSNATDIRLAVERCGFAHFLADDTFAPMDAALFAFRRRTNAVAVPTLATASLLAKKVAVGVRVVGLDVRVGAHGNFGATLDEAREAAILFCRTAKVLGIEATCFLNTSPAPAQPWLGRGESLVALALGLGLAAGRESSTWLSTHVLDCCRMADETLGPTEGVAHSLAFPAMGVALAAHLEEHGSSLAEFRDRADEVIRARRATIKAPEDGILLVDLAGLRQALVEAQAQPAQTGFTDPAGVELLVPPGAYVAKGAPIARVRCERSSLEGVLSRQISAALRVVGSPTSNSHEVVQSSERLEVVRA